MQVSKILVILIFGLTASLFIASPALAVEHPWEEGETGRDIPDNGLPSPDDDVPPSESQPPLWSSIGGSGFFWFHIIWDQLIGNDAMHVRTGNSEPAADTDIVEISHQSRMSSPLR